jgi:trehalose 6-phosphate synthase
MPATQREWRMRRMRRAIRAQDIFWWVDSFLHAAIAKDLTAFPLPPDYTPHNTFLETVS